jgi:hypothetical protein
MGCRLMPFRCEAFRVLIASPSDLGEERLAAAETVYDWNAKNAKAEGAVLLPVRWETHSFPRIGTRPQTAINRQIVEPCDLLLGLFWTKIGTRTGKAESGTVEEIQQFIAAGKPAMLYFSRRPVDPGVIDLKQQEKLRQFREQASKSALVGSFDDVDDLRQVLDRDLTHQARELISTRHSKSRTKSNRTYV